MFSSSSLEYYYIVDSRFATTPSETWKKITYTYSFSLKKTITVTNTFAEFFDNDELYAATDNLNRTDLYDSTLVVMLPGGMQGCNDATLKISANGISKEVNIQVAQGASCYTFNLCEIFGATLTKDTEISVSLVELNSLYSEPVYFRYNDEIKTIHSSQIQAGGDVVFNFKISQITQREVEAFYNDNTMTYYYITSTGKQISQTYTLTHEE